MKIFDNLSTIKCSNKAKILTYNYVLLIQSMHANHTNIISYLFLFDNLHYSLYEH